MKAVGHVRERLGDRRGITRIVAADGLEQQRRVGDGGGERADLVEARRERDEPVAAHPPERRLHAHHAAQRRRLADGAAGVRTEARSREAGGDRSRRTTRGAAGHAAGVERVLRRLERRVLGGAAHGELVEVGLADHDGAGCHEPLDDGGVVWRAPAVEDPRRAGGRHAPGAHVVLERDRHPGERPGGLAGGDALVDGIGGGTGVVGQHGDERVDVGLASVDAGEVLVDDLPCAAVTRADRRGDAGHAVRQAGRRTSRVGG